MATTARPGRTVAVTAVALLVALPMAFFLVFAGVFTDAPGGLLHPERLVSFALVVAAYAAAATAFNVFEPRAWWWSGWLAGPALALLVWYTTREPGGMGLHIVYAVLVVGAVVAGQRLGARVAARRRGA